MSKTSYLDEPADIKAEPGTKTWARGIAAKIKFVASKLDFDVSSVQSWIHIAVEHDAWKVLGYVSLDVFLVSEAGITQDFIDAIRNAKKGTSVGDVKAKIADAKANPLAVIGAPEGNQNAIKDKVQAARQHPTESGTQNKPCNTRIDYGTVDYTLRRLARDCPEMLAKIEAGELSVNAAAIAAGIRKKPTPEEACVKAFAKAANRLQVFQLLVSQLDPHEVEVVSMWLKDKAASS
jgi:hypothetical protein